MPPKVRFSRDAVVAAALSIIRESGPEAVNARAVAHALGCSTQPLFRDFQTMEQLKQAAAVEAMGVYQRYVNQGMATAEKPYKAAGMAYLRFAQEEPQLFKLLFMRDRAGGRREPDMTDASMPDVLDSLMKATGVDWEQARLFHLYSWIFVHGIASMIATNYVQFTDQELDGLLADSFLSTRLLFQHKQGEAKR